MNRAAGAEPDVAHVHAKLPCQRALETQDRDGLAAGTDPSGTPVPIDHLMEPVDLHAGVAPVDDLVTELTRATAGGGDKAHGECSDGDRGGPAQRCSSLWRTGQNATEGGPRQHDHHRSGLYQVARDGRPPVKSKADFDEDPRQ